MKHRTIMAAYATAMLFSILFVAAASSAANGSEYCRRDASSDMWNCSYSNMEQCSAAASGRGGYCRRDPFFAVPSASAPWTSRTMVMGHWRR
ncbi:DUF3551 domain-containing protein [Bradyrhizobium japonicum]|nr:DUF3551 domain-containing protein [Bradyrhizobium japonicum]